MDIKLTIQPQRIADMMVTAIEGNDMTRSWCGGIYLQGSWKAKRDQLESPWYSDPKLYVGPDCTIEVLEITDERSGEVCRHRINLEDINKGFAVMAKDYPQSFADFMAENEDAFTADTWLQCVVLGSTVYG